MFSRQIWSHADRTGILYKTPLSYVRCSWTHLIQEPLHFCSASVAGSVWLLLTFCRHDLTMPCFPVDYHLSSWEFPVDADLLSAHVEAIGKWGGVIPWSKLWPVGNRNQQINFSLFFSLGSQFRDGIIHMDSWKMFLGDKEISHAWSEDEARSIMHHCIWFLSFPTSLSFPWTFGEQKKIDQLKLMEKEAAK